MTCYLCACGTPIYYDSMHDTEKGCEGCDREYTVDKQTGKLIEVPPLEEFNLNKRDPFGEK